MVNKKDKKVIWIIGIILLINYVGAGNLFAITKAGGGFDNIIESDYVVKFGFNENKDTIDDFGIYNFYIDNAYGIGVFDTPLILKDNFKDDLIESMEDINKEIEELEDEISEYFDSPLFSQELIDLVEENSFDIKELKTAINELHTSKNKVCDAVKEYIKDHPEADIETIVELCDTYPDEIFVEQGGKLVLNLKKDFTYYDYRTTYNPIGEKYYCSDVYPDGCEELVPVSGSDKIVYASNGLTYGRGCSACNGICRYGYGTLGIPMDVTLYEERKTYCESHNGTWEVNEWYQKTERTRELKDTHTIRLSEAKIEIDEKKGDIIIAVGSDGIKEANSIEGKYEFAQYAYQIEHKDAHPSSILFLEGNRYTVISNSQDVVDAGEGEIDETSTLDDLWYGIENDLVKPTSVLGNYWIYIIGLGLILYFWKK